LKTDDKPIKTAADDDAESEDDSEEEDEDDLFAQAEKQN
jgi:hypothetical protein